MSASSVCQHLLHLESVQGCLYPGSPLCNKLPFQIIQNAICGTIMTTFVLDAIPVNVTFHFYDVERHIGRTHSGFV